jgi:hypothetical protein
MRMEKETSSMEADTHYIGNPPSTTRSIRNDEAL